MNKSDLQGDDKLKDLIINLIIFLGRQDGLLQKLSLETGLLPDHLYQNLMAPEIQAGIMDFLFNHEDLLIKFCEENHLTVEETWRIRLMLPGALLQDRS